MNAAILLLHVSGPMQPDDLWTQWPLEPGILLSIAIPAVLYAIGARASRGVSKAQMVCFWSGLAANALALASPLHPMGEALFSAHMAQHEILMLVAAPLLVLSRPLTPMLWALPFPSRRALGRCSKTSAVQGTWNWLTRPLTAWCLHAIALWVWHAPALFMATLRSEWVHTAQHLSFFLTALLFWWSFLSAREWGSGVISIFTTAAHTSILGALLTFSPTVLYPAYSTTAPLWGLTALQDQQIGGLIMWVPAGVVYMAAGLATFWQWLRQSSVAAAVLACITLVGCGARAGTVVVPGGDARRAPTAIAKYGCGSCHTIGGIPGAHGMVGPPLTGLRNRMYVAGMMANTPENLRDWIQKPKEINPRTAMPQLGVSQQEAADIAAYIYSIR